MTEQLWMFVNCYTVKEVFPTWMEQEYFLVDHADALVRPEPDQRTLMGHESVKPAARRSLFFGAFSARSAFMKEVSLKRKIWNTL